jgi:hypothetical protein
MIIEALDLHYKQNKKKYRQTLNAKTSENTLIEIMDKIPNDIDSSSLPIIEGDKREVVISVESYENKKVEKYFTLFADFLDKHKIDYKIGKYWFFIKYSYLVTFL